MSFVIPSIFSAIDGLTAPVRAMMRTMSAFSAASETAGVKANRAFNKIGTGADRAFNALNPLNKINGLLAFTGLTVGAAGLIGVFNKIVQSASNVENAIASYQGLLGSTDKAKQLVKDLYDLGAQTPFGFKELNAATQTMIGFGVATEKTAIPTLRMLGDIAQGSADKLSGITLAYSQILAGGRATMQDINQLINNGVPILGQLAKQWKMTGGAVREAVSKGKASSAEITKAFEAMTGKGGMFFNGMAIASKTFSGKMSSLVDSIDMVYASIGDLLLPLLKEYVDKAATIATNTLVWIKNNKDLINSKVSEWVNRITKGVKFLYENFDTILKVTKVYVGTLIVLKAASMGFAIAQGIVTGVMTAYNVVLGISTALQGKSAFFVMGNAVAYGAYRAAVVTSTAAQWLLNAALAANPLGATIAALVALIAIIVLAVKHYKSWGATLLWFLGPIGLVVSALKSIYDNWDLIKKGFSTGGIIGALKALGAVLLDVILLPLQQILSLMGNLPGAVGRAANSAADKIADLRSAMGTGVNQSSGNAVQNPFGNSLYPAINPKQAQAQMLEQTINKNTTNKQNVQIDINDKTGQASVAKNTGVPLVLTSTMGKQN